MYLVASLSVCILLSLSEGSEGMSCRSKVNAELRDSVRFRSRTFAMTRCWLAISKPTEDDKGGDDSRLDSEPKRDMEGYIDEDCSC